MAVDVQPARATLGATIRGVQLATLDDGDWKVIEDAFHEHAVLVFPAQRLDDAQQIAFARRFGDIEDIGAGDIASIRNRDSNGVAFPADHSAAMLLRGNEDWHTDSSYMALSAKASVLSAHVVPSEGGTTQWADMRAAYDALPNEVRARVDTLSAHHSIAYAQAKLGLVPTGYAYGFSDEAEPLRPLVKVHPVTRRRSLFIGRHAHAIPGLEEAESERVLAELMTGACQPPRVFEHRWEVGDIAVWDNRCLLHRARPFDAAEARVMKHTRVKGDAATESAATAG